jgi:hypothetical protein
VQLKDLCSGAAKATVVQIPPSSAKAAVDQRHRYVKGQERLLQKRMLRGSTGCCMTDMSTVQRQYRLL